MSHPMMFPGVHLQDSNHDNIKQAKKISPHIWCQCPEAFPHPDLCSSFSWLLYTALNKGLEDESKQSLLLKNKKCISTSVSQQHKQQSSTKQPLSQRALLAVVSQSMIIENRFFLFSNFNFFKQKSGVKHVLRKSVLLPLISTC